ncbi:hypothetical protein U1Q18_018209, partial [Sarracenia purpurea var. burkii]
MESAILGFDSARMIAPMEDDTFPPNPVARVSCVHQEAAQPSMVTASGTKGARYEDEDVEGEEGDHSLAPFDSSFANVARGAIYRDNSGASPLSSSRRDAITAIVDPSRSRVPAKTTLLNFEDEDEDSDENSEIGDEVLKVRQAYYDKAMAEQTIQLWEISKASKTAGKRRAEKSQAEEAFGHDTKRCKDQPKPKEKSEWQRVGKGKEVMSQVTVEELVETALEESTAPEEEGPELDPDPPLQEEAHAEVAATE